jgi:hypothetical protein
MAHFDFDRMNNADAAEVAKAALAVVDKVQDTRKEVQTLAIAAAFLIFCRRVGAVPQEVFPAATNLLATKYREHPALQALDMYVRYEL